MLSVSPVKGDSGLKVTMREERRGEERRGEETFLFILPPTHAAARVI